MKNNLFDLHHRVALVTGASKSICNAIDDIRDQDWDYLIELNLTGVMTMTLSIVPSMKASRGAA